MEDILSAPTTTILLYAPVSIYLEAVATENKNPEQAAIKSNPNAFLAPILSAIIQAVEGNNISGVAVAQIIKSISSALIPLFSNNRFIAFTPRSEDPRPSPFNILLSLIPVLEVIHSSFVSTIFSNSLFVRT